LHRQYYERIYNYSNRRDIGLSGLGRNIINPQKKGRLSLLRLLHEGLLLQKMIPKGSDPNGTFFEK
jgi:hypothetical protein